MTHIYKITNIINGKIYIGKTARTIEERFKEHISDSKRIFCKNRPLYAAIRKYGVENFFVEEIDFCEDDQEGCEREKYWIKYFNSYENGYNATIGGDGITILDYNLIFTTYQQLQNCNEVAKLLNIDAESVSRIVKQKGGIIKSGQKVNKEKYSKSVDMLTLDDLLIKTFLSVTDAAKYIQSLSPETRKNLSGIHQHITEAAKSNKRKSAYGYHWRLKES